MEIVTGYVQSNILHHGLHAPADSFYLPIKEIIEKEKSQGNKNGMPAGVYAQSVVSQILQKRTKSELWQGKLAWQLRLLVTFCPLWFIVSLLLFRYKCR
jgi:1-acylglycerone phosphate reductase